MSNLACTLDHHIGVEGPFEQGLGAASPREVFEARIDWLERHYDVVDLETCIRGRLPKKPLLLTFDDAFQSSFEAIRDVLAPRGLPSVMFANPGLLQQETLSLDRALAWAVSIHGLSDVCRLLDLPCRRSVSEIILTDMSRLSATERTSRRKLLVDRFGPLEWDKRAPLMRVEDLKLLKSFGADLGNHTDSHVHCRSLTQDELQTEIVDAKLKLEALSGQKVRSFSVPYGHEADLTEPVLQTLRASGHEAIFLVHARANILRPDPDIWYRVSLHDEAPSALRMALTYKPLLRTVKKKLLG